MVTIESGVLSARFMVVWVGQLGSSEDGMFGVKALQPERRIFRVDPGEPRPDGYVPPSTAPVVDAFTPKPAPAESWDRSERRGAHRIRCSGTGQISQPGVAFPIWANVFDVSMGGCYVEMVFTMPRGSAVEAKLTINSRTFGAKGKVVTSHPGVGVGIKFTDIAPEDQKMLGQILQELPARKPRSLGTSGT
jgi:PilZ domain-containing protein